jgi:hypothetical protein
MPWNGAGRLCLRVRRAFLGEATWTTGALTRRVFGRRPPFNGAEYGRIRAAAVLFADPISGGKLPPGIVWRAKSPVPPLPRRPHSGYLLHYHRAKLEREAKRNG